MAPYVSPSMVRRRGSSPGGKGILQQKPKYQTAVSAAKPTVADKRDDLPQERGFASISTSFSEASTSESARSVVEESIPDVFIDTIFEGFGPEADLFQDIMKIDPDAEPRQLRICYFRRGREILTEGGVNGLGALASGDNVPDLTKTRFQAVSMAYEILSNPTWKAFYMKHGLKRSGNKQSVDSSNPPPSKIFKVKWNESVEELIFDREPDEKLESFERKKNRNKKAKTKILIEGDSELNEHLAKLDQEAQPHFVTDFFDSLEESLDGLLKLAGSVDEQSSTGRQRNANRETSSLASDLGRGLIKRVTSNDEDSLVGMFATHILGISPSASAKPRNTSTSISNQVSPESSSVIPLSHLEPKVPVPLRCVSPEACRDGDARDKTFPPTPSVSSKQDVKQKKDRLVERPKEEERHELKVDGDDDEDVFYGLDDEKPSSICLLRRTRAASPANLSVTSMVSELSESVANQSHSPETFEQFLLCPDESKTNASKDDKPNRPNVDNLFKDLPDEEFFEDTWCQTSQGAISLPCGMCDPSKGEKTTVEEENDGRILANRDLASGQDEGFLEVFKAFSTEMNVDWNSSGTDTPESDWKDAILGAFVVKDEELEKLMEIVATEIQKAPALDAKDAMGSPAQLVIETAKSFS